MCEFRCCLLARMGILQMAVKMHQHQVGVAMQQAPMLLCGKDPWMQACTTLMAIPLLMSMTMLMVVRIPLAAPRHNFKPSNFISSCFCFAMDFATLGIFLHVHPFLHNRFFECASHSFCGFLSLNSQWQVNGMTILNMQVLMLGNFSPLYVTCSKPPAPPLFVH